MNNRFHIFMEFIWLLVLVASTGFLTITLLREEFQNSIAFAVMAIMAAIMYLYRRNKRKNG